MSDKTRYVLETFAKPIAGNIQNSQYNLQVRKTGDPFNFQQFLSLQTIANQAQNCLTGSSSKVLRKEKSFKSEFISA